MRFKWSMGEVVVKLRQSQGLTQVELAKKAKVSRSTVARLEGGKGNSTERTVQRVAEGLLVTPSQILRLRERFARLSGVSWLDDLNDDQVEKVRQMVEDLLRARETEPPHESPAEMTEEVGESHEGARKAQVTKP